MLRPSEIQDPRVLDITNAIIKLICTQGVEAVTMRRVAETDRMSLGGLTSHLKTRRRMLLICGSNLGERRQLRFDARLWHEGWPAFLPADESDLWLERAWLGWWVWARHDEGLCQLLERYEDHQRRALVEILVRAGGSPHDADGGAPLDARARATWAAVTGLRDELCRPGASALDIPTARVALGALVAPADARANPVAEGDSLTP